MSGTLRNITLPDAYWDLLSKFNENKFADTYSKKIQLIMDKQFPELKEMMK